MTDFNLLLSDLMQSDSAQWWRGLQPIQRATVIFHHWAAYQLAKTQALSSAIGMLDEKHIERLHNVYLEICRESGIDAQELDEILSLLLGSTKEKIERSERS